VGNIVRKRIENFVKLFIGLGLLIFLANYVSPKKIIDTFKNAEVLYLMLSILLVPFNLFLQFAKWKLLCKKYFNINSDRSIWLSLFYGISGGIFTPMKSGEYFARILPLKGVKVVDVVIATAVDKLIPIFFVIIIGGIFFILFLQGLLDYSFVIVIILIIIYLVAVFIPLLFIFFDMNISIKFRVKLRKIKFLSILIEKISFIRNIDIKTFTKLILISLFYHLTFTIQMALLLSTFSREFEFVSFFIAANLIIFTQIVIPPIALGELGVREGAAVFYVQNLGYPAAIGFNAALSLFTINLLIPSVIGLFLLLKRN